MNDTLIHIDVPINCIGMKQPALIEYVNLLSFIFFARYRDFFINIYWFMFFMIAFLNECRLINKYFSQMDFEMIYVSYTSLVKQSISR